MSRVLAFIWHTLCCSVPPLHHGKGKALDASRKLALRAAFSAVSFCNVVAKTVEIRKTFHSLIVPTTKRSVGRRHYMAHSVCDDDQALALGGGTIWRTLCDQNNFSSFCTMASGPATIPLAG